MPLEELVFPDSGCFGCSPRNPISLGIRFFRDGDATLARVTLDVHHCGFAGIAHGGVVATILDEVCCAAAFVREGVWVATGEMTLRYEQPCPVGAPLEARARVVDDSHARYLLIEAELRCEERTLATVLGRFFRTRTPQAQRSARG